METEGWTVDADLGDTSVQCTVTSATFRSCGLPCFLPLSFESALDPEVAEFLSLVLIHDAGL